MERNNSRKKTAREEKKEIYIKEHYEGVMFRVHNGERERLQTYAKKLGLSVNEFLYQSVEEKIKRIDEEGPHSNGETETFSNPKSE
ncbi:MAG: hypothetical protein SPK77_04810 [Lachnospiraceae bacterium]|nr:hypothetical protein [Lachnospiraceae bacterium]